jgi:hypothetical protein
MSKAYKPLILSITLWLFPALVHASVIVNSSLSLTHLQISPSAGSVQFLSPFNASAFTQVFDSLGGFDQQYNSVDDGATSAASATALVSATAAASAPALTASTTANLFIPQITASAGSNPGSPYGLLQGYFQIVGTTGPVTVQLNATLNENQFVSTTGYGLSATSEAIFNLLLPDIIDSPVLFFDDPLSIGTNASTADSSSPTLTASVTLQAGTPYYLIANADTDFHGSSMTPEPASWLLLLTGSIFCGLSALRRESARRSRTS